MVRFFENRKKILNPEIEPVVLNTINPLQKIYNDFIMDFSFFVHKFLKENLRKFISQMGTALWVYGTLYKFKKSTNLL